MTQSASFHRRNHRGPVVICQCALVWLFACNLASSQQIVDKEAVTMEKDRIWMNWASRQLIMEVDWARPELQAIKPTSDALTDDLARAIAISFVQHLRNREKPVIGYSAADVLRIRNGATEEERRQCRAELLDLIEVKRTRRIGLCKVDTKTLHVGASADIFLAQARKLGTTPPGATPVVWGTTAGIVHSLEQCWAMENCPDEYVVYMLAWLTKQAPTEWEWARTWDENMLGNAGHNWWLHTLSGLWKAGLYFPELKAVEQFQTFAPDYFNHEITTLFKSDGFSRERSGYHFGMADLADKIAYIADLHGLALNAEAKDRLAQMAHVPWKLIAPDGGIPHIGDGFRNSYKEGPYFFTLERLAGRYQIPESKFVAERLPDRGGKASMHILQTDYTDAYNDLKEKEPATVDTELPDSHYYIMRENWTPTADWMCIDAGSMGVRGASHDHADIFGFTAYAKGQPILLDNSCGRYDNSPERHWRIGTAAHNAATVNGMDALIIQNQWRRGNRVIPEIERWVKEPEYAYFSGVHDAYELRDPSIPAHRRKIFYLRGEYWIVVDRFTASDEAREHDYVQHFHLPTPVTQSKPQQTIAFSELADSAPKAGVICAAAPGLTVTVEPNPYPDEHSDNPDHLMHSLTTKGSGILVTVIAPFSGETAPDLKLEILDVRCNGKKLTPWQATALAITIDDKRDVYFDQHMHWNLRFDIDGEYSTQGRLFHSRIPSLNR